MKLKRLSLFLALVMILSAFAGTFTFASAADTKVWKVGSDTFATLSEAGAKAVELLAVEGTNEVTITLTGNATCDTAAGSNHFQPGAIASGKKLIVDGNGYTVTAGTCRYIQWTAAGTLELKDITISGTGTRSVMQINNGSGQVILNHATIENNSTNYAIVLQKNSNLYVSNGSTVTQLGTGKAIQYNEAGATLTIEDSTIKANTGYGIYGQPAGEEGALVEIPLQINNSVFILTSYDAIAIGAANTYQTIVLDECDFVVYNGMGINVSAANSGARVSNSTIRMVGANSGKTTSAVLRTTVTGVQFTVTNSLLSAAGTQVSRAVYSNQKDTKLNVTNSVLMGADSGNAPIKSSNASGDLVFGENVFVSGGHTNYQNPSTSADNDGMVEDTNGSGISCDTHILYTSSKSYWTNATIANNATEAEIDAFAAKLGLPYRVKATAAEAYDNGAFTHYYTTLAEAAAVSETVYIVGDTATEVCEAYGTMTSLTGVAKADGSYPTIWVAQRFTANITTAVTWQNINVVNMYGDCNAQINGGGVLTLNNVGMTHKGGNGCLVVQTGAKVIVNNCTMTAYSAGTLRLNEGTAAAEVNNSTLYGKEAGYPVYVVNGGTNATLKVDADSVLDATEASSGIHIYSGAASLTIEDSTVNIKVGSNSTGITTGGSHTGTLTIVDSTVKTYGNDSCNNTVFAPITTYDAGTINIINSTLDGSEAAKHRAIYALNATLNITNSTLKASEVTNTCPVIKATASKTNFNGINTVSGGSLKKYGAIWFFEDNAGKAHMSYATPEAKSITLGTDMRTGAGVRTVKNSSGIRFISEISADVNATLKAALAAGTIQNYSFGTIIMKASDLEGTTVQAAIAGGATNVAIPANTGKIENDDGSVNIYAALVNIKQQNLNVEFAGIAYIDIVVVADDPATEDVDETVSMRIYSEYNAEENARSITEVAKKALGDVKTTSSNELVEGFRYNNELAVGEKYYVDGVAKTVEEGDKLYSAYNADQRATIAEYLA